MTCACVENKDGTEILTPCQLHAQWAKAYAAQTWRVTTGVTGGGQKVQSTAPSKAGPRVNMKTPWEEPR